MSEDLTKKLPQSDSEKLSLILSTVQSLTVRVDNIDSRLLRVEQGVGDTRAIFQNIDSRLRHVEQTVDETRPILQKVVADILQLQEGQRALSNEVRAMRRDLDNRFGVIYDKLVEIEIDDRNIHDRVTRLELSHHPPNSET